MQKIKLQLITPEKVIFSEEVDRVSFMTKTGEITVLPNHIPLVTLIEAGELRYKKNETEHYLAVSGGFAEIRKGSELVVLADSADYAHEIDLDEAEIARKKAVDLMQEKQQDDIEYETLQTAIKKELNKIKIGNKYRKLPSSKK